VWGVWWEPDGRSDARMGFVQVWQGVSWPVPDAVSADSKAGSDEA